MNVRLIDWSIDWLIGRYIKWRVQHIYINWYIGLEQMDRN